MGPDYTLLRFDDHADAAPLLAAARDAGVPMTLLDVRGVDVPAAYTEPLVLSRPDRHVA